MRERAAAIRAEGGVTATVKIIEDYSLHVPTDLLAAPELKTRQEEKTARDAANTLLHNADQAR
jgi:hypothetical protein